MRQSSLVNPFVDENNCRETDVLVESHSADLKHAMTSICPLGIGAMSTTFYSFGKPRSRLLRKLTKGWTNAEDGTHVLSRGSKSRRFSASTCHRATHYEALGVRHGATRREIKTAFYKLSKELHPDRNPNADEASKKRYLAASEAYAILGDDRRRRDYEKSSHEGPSGSFRSSHGQAPDLTRRAKATHAWDYGRRQRHPPHPSASHHPSPPPRKNYHYPNASGRLARSGTGADGKVYTEFERYATAEDRVRKDSGFWRTLQFVGVIGAIFAFAGLSR